MQNFNNLRGFNKTPGQLGEAIYNSVHKPKPITKENKVEDYYKRNVKDPSKQINQMKQFTGFKGFKNN